MAESFTCPRCGITSHNPNDIKHRYCARCGEFAGDQSDNDILKAIAMKGRRPNNPIGTCFDSSFMQMLFGKPSPPGLTLCHGLGVANMPGIEGEQIMHAWLEYNWTGEIRRIAFDTTWNEVVPADVYREGLKLSYVIEYPKHIAIELGRKHDNSGPWDEKIKAFIERKEKECKPKS